MIGNSINSRIIVKKDHTTAYRISRSDGEREDWTILPLYKAYSTAVNVDLITFIDWKFIEGS